MNKISDNVYDIINGKPNRFLNYGSGVLFLFFSIILILSFLIKYPDYIEGDSVIVSSNHAKKILAKKSGRLELFTEDIQKLKKNQIIGIVNSSSNNLIHLKPLIDSIERNPELLFNEKFQFNVNLNLGETENAFVNMLESRNEFFLFKNLKIKKNTIDKLGEKLALTNNVSKSINTEKKIQLQKLEIEKKILERQKKLYLKGVISKQDLENSEEKFFDYQNLVQDKITNLNRNLIDKKNIDDNIKNLMQEHYKDSVYYKYDLKNNYNTLKSEIKKWEYFYNFTSPEDGKFFFSKHWSNGQMITEGEELGTLLPDVTGEIFCEAFIESFNSGKVKKDQKAKIYLESFPFEEYGLLNATIVSISEVPKINKEGIATYRVKAVLDSSQLKTSTGYNIYYTPNLKGKIKITTKDLSLFKRLIHKISRIKEDI